MGSPTDGPNVDCDAGLKKRRVQPDADFQCVVDPLHRSRLEVADAIPQAGAVDGAELLQQGNGFLGQPTVLADGDMGGQLRFLRLPGDGADDDGGAEMIANVVLQNEDGPNAALFAPDNGGQVCVENVATADAILRAVQSAPPTVFFCAE